jgi:hypothetical protein
MPKNTTEFAQTEIVQNKLSTIKKVILPNHKFEIAHR